MTAAEALAACLALGTPRDVCEEKVRSQMVGGTYCDGTIVMRAGEPPRCVPASTLAQKQSQARIPTSSPDRAAGLESVPPWAIVAGVVAVAGLAWLALRRR